MAFKIIGTRALPNYKLNDLENTLRLGQRVYLNTVLASIDAPAFDAAEHLYWDEPNSLLSALNHSVGRYELLFRNDPKDERTTSNSDRYCVFGPTPPMSEVYERFLAQLQRGERVYVSDIKRMLDAEVFDKDISKYWDSINDFVGLEVNPNSAVMIFRNFFQEVEETMDIKENFPYAIINGHEYTIDEFGALLVQVARTGIESAENACELTPHGIAFDLMRDRDFLAKPHN